MTTDVQLYDDVVDMWRTSVFTGGKEVQEETTMVSLLDSEIPILVEFAKDNDLQSIQVCSANIGMISTYQKRYSKGDRT